MLESFFTADWQETRKERLGRIQQLLGVNSQLATTPVLSLSSIALSGISLIIYAVFIVVLAPLVAIAFVGLALVVSVVLPAAPPPKQSRGGNGHVNALRELQFTATSYVQLNRELHVFGHHARAVKHLSQMNDEGFPVLPESPLDARLVPALFQQFLLVGVLLIVSSPLTRPDLDASAFGAAAVLPCGP